MHKFSSRVNFTLCSNLTDKNSQRTQCSEHLLRSENQTLRLNLARGIDAIPEELALQQRKLLRFKVS